MQKMCNTETEGKLYVFLMFTLFPLFVVDGYSNITLTKCITFITLLAFFVVTLIVNYVTAFTAGNRPKISVKRAFSKIYFPDWFLFLMLLFTAVSCLLSSYKGVNNSVGQSLLLFGAGRFDGILFIFAYVLIFWLTSRHGKFNNWFALAFAITTGVLCVISIIQLSGVNVFNLYPKHAYKGYYENFVATIGNVDMMAGYLSMAWPLAWVGYVLLSYDSKDNLPKFITKQGAKDVTKAFLAFEKFVRYIFLIVLGMSVYLGLQIGVELFKVAFVSVLFVMIPLLIRSLKSICRLLDSLSVMLVAVGLSSAITYTYVKTEKKTITQFEFNRSLILCIALAIVVFIGAVVIRKIKNNKEKNRKKSKKGTKEEGNTKVYKYISLGVVSAEILGIIGAFCYFRFIYTPTVQSGIMYDLYEFVRGNLTDTAGSHRGAIWKYSIRMAKENLLFGTGTGTFAKSFKEFTKEVGYFYYQNKNLDFAHNEYIHILCTTGLFGLLTYLGFLMNTAYLSVKTMAKNPKILVLSAAVLGYLFQAFFSFSIVIITPIFWVLIGLLVKEARDTLIINNNCSEEK